MKTKVILFELNEVPYKILDWYIGNHPHSNLALVAAKSEQYRTLNEDAILSPWVTWPSVHRGVFDSHHGISFLGQDLQNADKKYPPVWQMLAAKGVKCGIFGSLHTFPLPAELNNYPFYVPDVFAKESDTHPDVLRTFQELNLVMSRESARNVSAGIPKKLALELALQLPALGISLRTVWQTIQQLIAERLDNTKLCRRRVFQSILAFDAYMHLLKTRKPDFTTFFTNHVASNMHRFWASNFPEDFAGCEQRPDWSAQFNKEIEFAMDQADNFIGQLMQFVHKNSEYSLWIATSMGQGPAREIPYLDTMLLVSDLNKFMSRLGLLPSDWEQRPAMVPDYCVFVSDEKTEMFRGACSQLYIAGHQLSLHELEDHFFHFAVGHHDLHKTDQTVTLSGQKVPFDEMGLSCVKSQDSIASSGDHIREGMFITYAPAATPATNKERPQMRSTEIAARILQNYDIAIPEYMRQPTLAAAGR
ncbi:MAG TPA: hypothetical protein V6C81_01635 [Planktothrix sp.]|jgi:hypothetical protein